MSTFWQPCVGFAQVDSEGNVVFPLRFRLSIPEGGAEWGKAFYCHTVTGASASASGGDWPPLKRARVAEAQEGTEGEGGQAADEQEDQQPPAEGAGEEAEGDGQEGAGEERQELEEQGGQELEEQEGAGEEAEAAGDEIDEDILDSLSDALVPRTPLAAGVAGGGSAASSSASSVSPLSIVRTVAGAFFGEYKLRPRRCISAELEVFVLNKFLAASAQPEFKVTAKWLADTKRKLLLRA